MAGRGPPKRSGQKPRNIINIGDPRSSLPSGSLRRQAPSKYEGKIFGQIVSVNNGFGFLQPYGEKEQAYYNQRDAPPGLEVGSEVAFLLQRGARGLSAGCLVPVAADALVSTPGRRGVVVQPAEGARCPAGQIQLSPEEDSAPTGAAKADGATAPPLVVYVDTERRGGRPGLAAGDEVEFTLNALPGTSYGRATDLRLIMTRKERRRNEKIAALIASGATQEQGIVETVNKGGEFAFVKCADRTGQLYFKLSDVVSEEAVREGTEIQFLVIDEPNSGKGQARHRAVHVTVLPKGTVAFEVTLQAAAAGVVVKDPVFFPKEAPGLIRVLSPGRGGEDEPAQRIVELWPRCLPEGLLPRVGDSLQCDVVHYRPEKLIFARSVRVLAFRRLGRESGVVVKLQRRADGGSSGQFGFIKPDNRDHDIFFRIPDVVSADGGMLPDAEVTVGLRLSFDVIAEDGARAGGGGGRTRAIRACVEPMAGRSLLLPEEVPPASPEKKPAASPGPESDAGADPSRCLMRSAVKGVIARFPKKDQSGVIRILSDISRLAEVDFSDVLHWETIRALSEFTALEEWKEISMEHVGPRARKTLHTIIQQKFPGVAHETLPNPGESSMSASHDNSRTVKLWKLSPEEFVQWEAERAKKEKSELTNRLFKMMTSASAPVAPTELRDGVLPVAEGAAHDSVANPFYAAFTSSDITPSRWSMDKDSTVTFDLCLDASRNRLAAACVALTDEAPEEAGYSGKEGPWVFGRIDSVKHMKGGYIRCFPTDEKLRWEVPSVMAVEPAESGAKEPKFNVTAVWNHVASLLVPDTLVACQVRVKGGVRCAVGLHAVPVRQQKAAAAATGPEEAGPEEQSSGSGTSKEIEGVAKPMPEAFYANVTKKTETLYGECIAVVVENKHVVLLDVSTCPLLVNKYYDITDISFVHWLSKQLNMLEASRSGANAESWTRVEKQLESLAMQAAEGEEAPKDEVTKTPAAEDDEEAGSDDDEKGTGAARLGSAGAVTYLPRLHGFPIPFYVESKLSSNGGHYGVGELVVCSLVANWALQRMPLHANILRKFEPLGGETPMSTAVIKTPVSEVVPLRCQLEPAPTEAPGELNNVRRCGTVRKILSAASLFSAGRRGGRGRSSAPAGTLEQWAEVVCEVGPPIAAAGSETQEKEASSNTYVFLYDMRGLPKPIAPENLPDQKEVGASATARAAVAKQALASLSEGDLVDFVPVLAGFRRALGEVSKGGEDSAFGMAVAVNLVRSSGLDKNKKLVAGKPTSVPVNNPLAVRPRSSVINAALKDTQAKSGFKGSSMAEGPPDDKSVGFAPGWRVPIDTSSLPWAHLLPHVAAVSPSPPDGV